ncbi:unnamed protein product [Bursaphelenchus okinawaensis]|uniref:Minichromosome loss protein Mcl1 middle region domain-containing protein n=1 Tax=Bursaphelenchus okinawaensis TaxID=465554 RepID=A0A811KMA6_9BILA|nr:unnamed protein product [Bursaphelenchus okinawaensis]CAG9106562.1 unnamed protein product [Bursaphelenchus okinawaensis]
MRIDSDEEFDDDRINNPDLDIVDEPVDEPIIEPFIEPIVPFAQPTVPEEPKGRKLPKLLHPGQFDAKDGQKCLVWNRFGKIVAIENDDDNCVEVNFNDASVSEDFAEDNFNSNYCLADMNATTVVLASKKNEDKQSVLYVRNVTAWNRESRVWTKVMPEKEVIKACVCGQDFVAVYTDMRFLRIYSLNGVQRLVMSVANHVHAVVASQKQIAVITTSSLLEDGDNEEYQYNVEIMDVNVFKSNVISRRNKVQIATSFDSELSWISFTNKGHLVTMDSLFMVRVLNETNLWIPVFNGADELKDIDDNIWPIYVTEQPSPQFRYLYLRNRSHPSLKKTEVTTVSALKLPIQTSDNEKESELEAELLLNDFLTNTNRNSEQDVLKLLKEHSALMIKLFSEALKDGKEGKALEMAQLSRQLQTIQILCNFAAKQNRTVLSDKVAEVGRTYKENPQKENRATPSSTTTTPALKRMELKRRTTILPDVNNTTESLDISMNVSVDTNVQTFNDATAPAPLNPFKRQSAFGDKSPEKKKSKDLFGSLMK